jgi:N-methylhydantoinase A
VIELVNARIRARVEIPSPTLPALDKVGKRSSARRSVYFGPQHGNLDTPIVARLELTSPGTGPLIVEEYDTTVIVPPGVTATLDTAGNLVLQVGAAP